MGRRQLLMLAVGGAATAILAACGSTGAATDTPRPVPSASATAGVIPPAPSAPSSLTAGGAASAQATGQTLVIEAVEYGYKTLGSIPGGWTTVQLRNLGKEMHHAQFLLLNDGVALEQFAAASKRGPDAIFPLVTQVGGPGTVAPNGTTEVMLDLKVGRYVIVCFELSAEDHALHATKGMVMPLMVTAPVGVAAPAPPVAGTITLAEFSFAMPATMPAGRNLYRVVNQGAQFHEFNIMRIAAGKTVDDIRAFLDPPANTSPAGPPPGIPVGGMNALSKGSAGIAVFDLAPGNYAAVCKVPDQSKPNGDSHLHLGMIKGFTVA